MSLLDRVQRKAEEGSTPGAAAQPAVPQAYPMPGAQPLTPAPAEPSEPSSGWSLRASLATSAAPARRPAVHRRFAAGSRRFAFNLRRDRGKDGGHRETL